MEVVYGLMPTPSVIEGYPLCAAYEGVVETLGVERRVEVDQVNRFTRYVLSHHVKAIAKIKSVRNTHAVPFGMVWRVFYTIGKRMYIGHSFMPL